MTKLARKQYLNRAQVKNLPLLAIASLTLLFIFYGRNVVRYGTEMPFWHTIIACIVIAGAVLIAVLAWQQKITENYAQICGVLVVYFYAIANFSNMYYLLNTGIYSSALSTFGIAIAVLSLRVFIVSMLAYVLVWFAIVVSIQSVEQWLPTSTFVLVSALLGIFIFRQRVDTQLGQLEMLSRIDELESFLSLCANCRKLRDGDKWISFEEYMREKEGKEISHGICPQCKIELYGDHFPALKAVAASSGQSQENV